jgi:cbb3-type cytochrome oxidase subunit 1
MEPETAQAKDPNACERDAAEGERDDDRSLLQAILRAVEGSASTHRNPGGSLADARPGATYQVEPDFAARQSILWAIAWLIGGVTVTALAHILLIRPDLLGGFEYLSVGRLRSIADTTIVFGWLVTASFAAIYALLPRICEVQLHNEPLAAATTLTWSVIVTGGIVALLLGINQGRPLAELGAGADLGMALMLVAVLYNAGVTVVRRREKTLYASGWYLLMAALLAPLIFIVGNLPVFEGVTDAIVSGFYMNGVEMLWLLPVALGIAHYVVPVETGNKLYSAPLARIAFWSLAIAGGWTGQRFYMKGPGPDYLDSIAFAMTLVLLIPAISVAANLFATGRERWGLASQAFGLRWAAAGLGYLVAWIALVALTATPSVNRFIGVTSWQSGVRFLAMFGVFSSFAFAFISHAYPLMVGRDWFSRSVASFHFWATNIGVVVGTALLIATGAAQTIGQTAAQAAEGPSIVGLLRLLTAFAFLVVVVAQYAFVYNTARTSRSGPFIHPGATQAALQGSR